MSKSVELLLQRIAALDQKIAEKEDEATFDGTPLTGGNKAAITKWKLQLETLEAKLDELQSETKPVPVHHHTTETHHHTAADVSGQSRRRDAVNLMSRDILAQPELCPKLDVAVFCRRMGVVWNTHCKNSTELEADFLRILEQRLCQNYRHSYQVNTDADPITTWKGMEEYLLSKHKSNSTLFQELSQIEALTLGPDEYLRDFAARLKSCAGDVETVMKAKFRDMVKREMELSDLFEILQSDALIKQMTGHHVYKRHFDSIVKDLDSVYKPEDVASRASLYADRQVKPAPISSANQAYVSTQPSDDRLDRLESMMKSFVAGQKQQNQKSSSGPKPDNGQKRKWKKKRTWKELCEDSEFCERARTQPCHRERDEGRCSREKCPFKHSKPNGPSSSMIMSQVPSQHFH